jgi:hypothetical protein
MNEQPLQTVMLESGPTSKETATTQESLLDPNNPSVSIANAMSTTPGVLMIKEELVKSTQGRPFRNTANLCHAGVCDVRTVLLPFTSDFPN